MRVQRYALFPTPANLEGNFSSITTFLLHTPRWGAMTETWTESPHAEPRARVISQGHIEKPHGQQGCLDWLPLPVSRNHPEALLTALKRKSGHRPTEQQDQTKTKPQERATKPSVSVFQRFNQKKACPTTPSSLSAHTLILPFTLITETNCYNILYITYYILYIIINNTTIGERKGKTTPRLYLHWNAETLKHFE